LGTMWARNLAQNLFFQALNGVAFATDPSHNATQVSGDVTWFFQMTQGVKRKVETRMAEFYAVSTEIFPEATPHRSRRGTGVAQRVRPSS
jgi:hypothetical protein